MLRLPQGSALKGGKRRLKKLNQDLDFVESMGSTSGVECEIVALQLGQTTVAETIDKSHKTSLC